MVFAIFGSVFKITFSNRIPYLLPEKVRTSINSVSFFEKFCTCYQLFF